MAYFNRHKKKEHHTIAFYNLENFFDTFDDPFKLDDDFTPWGFKKWSKNRYQTKLKKLSKAINKIANPHGNMPPVMVGLAEVENKTVLSDLLNTKPLKLRGYDYIHFDSPDERGIDTALIYLKDKFEPISMKPISVLVHELDGTPDATRDILYVEGLMNKEKVHVFVNHWPSKRDGDSVTEHKRVAAAQHIVDIIEGIEQKENEPNFVIMGDFNANPHAESIEKLVSNGNLYNPMRQLLTYVRGSANYRREWNLFDQILVSHTFFNYEPQTHSFAHAEIFDEKFLKTFKGRYKGSPFRTYRGRKYLGGYSDHFPVYIKMVFHHK
jgi:predicted extracellular nuclease